MGIVFRQSIKATLVTLTGAVLGALANLAYVHMLPVQENGYRTSLFDQAPVLQTAILLGMSGTLSVFIHRYTVAAKRKLLLTWAAVIPFASFLVLLVPYALFREQIIHWYKPEDQHMIGRFYYWLPCLTLLWAYVYLLESYLSVHHKSAVAAFIREIFIRVVNLVLITLTFFGIISFSWFIGGCVLVYGVAALLSLRSASTVEDFGFSTRWKDLSREEYREWITFTWYHLLIGISFYAMPGICSYMLGILSKDGISTLSVFGMATYVASIVLIPFRTMTSAAYSTINDAYTSKNDEKLRNLFKRSSINILLVTMAMCLLIGCNLDNIYAIVKKPGYEDFRPLVLIAMSGRLIDASTGVNTELIGMSSYYKFNYRVTFVVILLLIVSNYLLIPRYGAYGAAWGYSISIVLFNIAKIFFLKWKFGIRSFYRETFYIVIAGVVAAAAGYFLPVIGNIYADGIIRSGVIVVVYAAMLFWLKPSEDLRTYLQTVKKNRKLF